jgi:hypothetical protein
MRRRLSLALAVILVSAALASPRVEATGCAECITQENSCVANCAGNQTCKDNCIDAWQACRCNVCHSCA